MAHEVPAEYVSHFFGACHGESQLEHFRECGARWKRGGSGWHEQEQYPGEYDFDDWDELTATADDEGVELLPVLNYTAPWASTAPDDVDDPHHYPVAEDHVEDWRAYVERFVDRYPDLTHFEIWNEPNLRKFLHVDEEQSAHEIYVDRVLKPAAKVLHDRGKKVVAPSITTEWPERDIWPSGRRPAGYQWNVESNIEMVDRWLSYDDAWQYVDYLSVHYTKGDTEKPTLPHSDNMMPFYQHVHDNYVETGKLDGIWNTEGGMTVVEADGKLGLEPWEREPYQQWVPRYTLPLVHWALRNGWHDRDDYKFFWYHMTHSGSPTAKHLIEKRDGDIVPSETGQALRTVSDLLTDGDEVGVYPDVRVGFGFESESTPPYDFDSYGFTLDDDVLVASWLDLPGLELDGFQRDSITAEVPDVESADAIRRIDYITGESTAHDTYAVHDGDLRIELPPIGDPVQYLRIER